MSDYYKLAAARLDKDRYDKLQTMADSDLRSLSDEIRWLIDGEWDRRDHVLVDPAAQYITAQVPDGGR